MEQESPRGREEASRGDRASKLVIPIAVACISVVGVILAAIIDKIQFSVVTLDQQVESVRELLDALEVPAMLYSEELRVVYSNERMASIYKMKKSDMVGRSPAMLNLLIKPHVENYREFAAEQLDRIAIGHRGETEGRAQVPMRLSGQYLGRNSSSDWYFVSNPVYIGGRRFTLTQLLEQVEPGPPCLP